MANEELRSDLPQQCGHSLAEDCVSETVTTRPPERHSSPSDRNLLQSREELRRLIAHLFTQQEDERQRVVRELHDDISQRLSLLEISMQQMEDSCNDREERHLLEAARGQVHSINTDVRQISRRLHPAILQDLGLVAALRAMVKEFGEREGMPASLLSHTIPDDLSASTATAVYRIAQEALRNVSQHAGKTHAKVSLEGSGQVLRLRVMDFGVGFDQSGDAKTRGLGMVSMEERARLAGGTLLIRSELGEGTSVTLEVPMERHE